MKLVFYEVGNGENFYKTLEEIKENGKVKRTYWDNDYLVSIYNMPDGSSVEYWENTGLGIPCSLKFKTAIETQLDDLKQKDFMLEMNDHWSSDDYELSRKYHAEIKRLEALIEKVGC